MKNSAALVLRIFFRLSTCGSSVNYRALSISLAPLFSLVFFVLSTNAYSSIPIAKSAFVSRPLFFRLSFLLSHSRKGRSWSAGSYTFPSAKYNIHKQSRALHSRNRYNRVIARARGARKCSGERRMIAYGSGCWPSPWIYRVSRWAEIIWSVPARAG